MTGVAPGQTVIIASSGGKQGQQSITVLPVPVATVTVAPASPSVVVGGTQQLTATLKDASGNTLTDRTVSWTTSDATKATVSSTGLVTAVAVGSATITATSEGMAGPSAVTILPVPVATVAVAPAALSVGVGGTQQLTAMLKDASGNTLTGRTVSWTTSDATKATVSSTGLVTAVAVGSATITASAGGVTGASVITVAPASASGVRLAVTSPRPASRWYVVVDSGTLTSPQMTKFPGNNRRVDTLLVPLSAGSGYRMRLEVADSASTDPDNLPLVTSGGRISGVSVFFGSVTPQSIAATALSAVVTIPDTVFVDRAVPIDLTLTDPSQVLSAPLCAIFYFGTASWATDGNGASRAQQCTPTNPSPTRVRYAWSAPAPSTTGTLFNQLEVFNYTAGQTFSFYVPSRQLGQPLRTTTVVYPATINTFGTTANKVSIVAIGSAITPALVTAAGGTGIVLTTDPTITFVARSPAIASVDGAGRITAVAPGQAWVAATSTLSNSDSVLIIVPRSSGPILRTDLTRFAFRIGDTVTARVQVDTRGATLGAVTATVAWPVYTGSTDTYFNALEFLDISTTGSPMAPVTTIDQTLNVIRINGESAAGVTGIVQLAVLRFIVKSPGTTGIFLNATELLGPDFSNLLPSATFTQYPVIVP